MFALWLRYVGPDTALSFSIQVDVLVMVVVGGMGSLYGAIIGAALFVFAESYLQDVMGALSQAAADAGLPLLPALFHPDRWLLWLGLAFVLAVYFAPTGIVGALKADEAETELTRSSFRGRVDHRAQFVRDFLLRVWLGDELHPRVKPPVMDDGVSGVTGREKDGQIGAQGGRLVGERPAVHALGENDIGEQDVDPRALFQLRQRLHAVACGQDRIAEIFKQSDGRIAHVVVVLHDQARPRRGGPARFAPLPPAWPRGRIRSAPRPPCGAGRF